MATPWEPVYTDQQREAVEEAYLDRSIRPARRVAELAKAGELAGLAPFTIPENTVRDIARKANKRRRGELRSGLTDVPHATAIDVLRKRLLSAADRELERLERRQRQGREISGEQLRQVVRAVRELAALPGPDEPRPVAPGATKPGTRGANGKPERDSERTTGGLAGAILHDVRRGNGATTEGARNGPDPSQREAEHEAHEQSTTSSSATQSQDEAETERTIGLRGS